MKFRNPFSSSPDAVYDSSRADLTYNTSGSSKTTALWHETSPGSFSYTKIFETQSPDDTSGMARPASWNVLGGPGGSNVATLPFAYDKSGNITSIGSDAYLYDSRSRLIQDSIVSRSAALNPERREYDGFGNIRRVTNGGNVATLAVNMGNNRLSESGMVWDEARGQLRYDTKDARNMWRDFYPDGRQLTDYYTLSGNVIDLLRGWSASLYDGAGERSLEYWSGGHECSDQVFRLPLRGDDAKVLTDYRGQYTSGECTYAAQWSKDYVWIGNRAQILLDRDSGTVRWRALNHLGTPRWAFDSAGNLTGQEQLDSWGGVIGTTLNERHKFTGHERDHALLANGYGPDPNPMADYMHTRTYVPMLGRFTSPDSVSRFTLLPQKLNRYTYVSNNPVTFVDPFGMEQCSGSNCSTSVEVTAKPDPIPVTFEVLHGLNSAEFRSAVEASKTKTRKFSMWSELKAAFTNNQLPNMLRDFASKPYMDHLGGSMVRSIADALPTDFTSPDQVLLVGSLLLTRGAAQPAITFGHGARHLAGTGLSQATVEGAIRAQVAGEVRAASMTGTFWGRVTVQGTALEYRAYTLPNGTVHIGTYYRP